MKYKFSSNSRLFALRTFKNSLWFRLALGLCLLFVAWVLFLSANIYLYSFANEATPADAAIVLGAAVWNKEPSPVFAERINHALNLYEVGTVKKLIFTGGKGPDEQLAEAEAGKTYALGHDVRTEDIFCETVSRSTYENLREAEAIVKREHLGRVLIVSDPLHMRRAMTIAGDLGLEAFPSPTPTTRYIDIESQMAFLLREVYYYGRYLVRRQVAYFLE